MYPLASKLIGREPERRSRFHDRRGVVRTSGLTSFPKAAYERALRRKTARPWMASGAVEFLDGILQPGMRLLELGSGASTSWYADRVGSVVSIEPDHHWFELSRSMLRERSNITLLHTSVADALPMAGQFDAVVVDHNDEPGMTRIDALSFIGAATIVVLDDSDRPSYRQADVVMADWTCQRFRGFRPDPLQLTETTVFTRLSLHAGR